MTNMRKYPRPKPTLLAIALVAFSLAPSAEVYQCREVTGCVATINTDDGKQKKVIFRKGDIVSTDAGWIVSTDDGWVRLRSKRGGSGETGVGGATSTLDWIARYLLGSPDSEGFSLCECATVDGCWVLYLAPDGSHTYVQLGLGDWFDPAASPGLPVPILFNNDDEWNVYSWWR